jgi:hypothetical protein
VGLQDFLALQLRAREMLLAPDLARTKPRYAFPVRLPAEPLRLPVIEELLPNLGDGRG